MKTKLTLAFAAILFAGTATVQAADPESCKTVRFADVGWTDIQATTAVAGVVLDALGYEQEVQVLSVPVTYQSLKNKGHGRLPRQLDAVNGSRRTAFSR